MSVNIIDARLCARMFLAGAKSLEAKKEWINELNVFPVPDGDTGTNMTMTIMSAAKEVSSLGENPAMDKLAKAMSSGSLRGARGNSGVILSQLLRGFCKVIRDQQEIDSNVLVAAFQKAVETAYKAVMKPKEGTILTVARAASERVHDLIEADPEISMEDLIKEAVLAAEDMLARTPDMLPVLKEAGVVDSGGQGLVQILKGCQDLYLGKELNLEMEEEETAPRFAYELSFLLVCKDVLSEDVLHSLKKSISKAGTEKSFQVHAHTLEVAALTNDPGAVLAKATAAGIITDVSIGNTTTVEIPAGEDESAPSKERKPVGFVTVSIGDGLGKIFKDLGADELIEGGQTMNPSTEDVIEAVEKVNADTVFVFPNNKNIILAASQAQTMVKDKKVIVVPTKNIPQGISCLINYMGELSPEENETAMHDAIKQVRTGQLTYAVRDTHVDEKEIHEGDFMGVGDKGILSVGSDLQQTALDMVEAMTDDDSELISIYYGADITEEDANRLFEAVSAQFPDYEVELNKGGQPVYYYIISVE